MKYNSIIKGKKGGILGSTLSNFGAYVAFVLVVIIFFTFFQIQTLKIIENRITGLEEGADKNTILLNYLRTPMEDDTNEQMTVSDFFITSIIELYTDNNYDKFISGINKVFEEYFSGKGRLMILLTDESCLYDSSKLNYNCLGRSISYYQVTEGVVKLPTSIRAEGFESIEVVLQ